MIAGQPAQRERLHREAGARAAVRDVDRGDQRAQQIAHRLLAAGLKILGGEHIDRSEAFGHRAPGLARAGDDDRGAIGRGGWFSRRFIRQRKGRGQRDERAGGGKMFGKGARWRG